MEAFELLHLKGPEEEAEVVTVETEANDDPKPASIFQTEQCFVTMERMSGEFGSGEMIDEVEENNDEEPNVEKKVKKTTPNKKQALLDQLSEKLMTVYNESISVFSPTVLENIKTNELVYENNKLVKAIHSCGLCDTKVALECRNSSSWQTCNFRRHLVRNCTNIIMKKNRRVSDASPVAKRRRTTVKPKEDETDTEEEKEDEERTVEEGEVDDTDSDDKSFVSPPSKRKSTNHYPLEVISQDQIDQYKKRLSNTLTAVYERKNVVITPQISEAIENSELVIEDNKLIKAIHFCGCCGSKMSIGYQLKKSYSAWRNFNLMRHLENRCLKLKEDGEKKKGKKKQKEEKEDESE